MSKFIGEHVVYYLERRNTKTNEERLMNYDDYEKIWRTSPEFQHSTNSEDPEYLQKVADMNTEMENFKVSFGIVSEPEFIYTVIKKEELTYYVDADGNEMTVPEPEPEPIPEDTPAGDDTAETGE